LALSPFWRRLPAAALVLLGGCATQQLVYTWQDPKVQAPRFHTVLVLATVSDVAVRRMVEDAFVQQAQAAHFKAIPGYSVLGDKLAASKDALKAMADKAGADSLLIADVLKVDSNTQFSPGYVTTTSPVYYGYGPGYYDYYQAGWDTYTPAETTTTVQYTIQTNLYSVATEKLVWTGTTQATRGTSMNADCATFAGLILGALEERQILAPMSIGAPMPPPAAAAPPPPPPPQPPAQSY
jgi:hypothetical protein